MNKKGGIMCQSGVCGVIVFARVEGMCYSVDVKINFQEALDKLTTEHHEYHAAAYKLLYNVSAPVEGLAPEDRFEPDHISVATYYGALLNEARRCYGPLAYTLFCYWGLHTNADVAKAIRHLVDAGLLMMSPHEKPEDICELAPLRQTLENPYIPNRLKSKHD